jgi:3-oxoacyl-[acyl-carrier-protein] synthase II
MGTEGAVGAVSAASGTSGAVVTGIGLVGPLGRTVEELYFALCEGRSGLTAPAADHPLAGVVEAAAFGPPIDPASVLPPSEARVVDRSIVMALRAAEDALADAGVEIGRDVDPRRASVMVGGVGGLETMSEQAVERTRRGRFGISPYLLPAVLPNMGAARIAIKFGIRGFSSAVGTACAAGAQSIGEGLRILRAGEADLVLCGCSEEPLFPAFADAFGNARALASGWADPEQASRPFDRRRNGLVLGEGAGVVVLERPEFAKARGARSYGRVLGWGASTDGYHPTSPRPDGEGAADAMRLALRDAGAEPDDVGYICAHGTSTKAGDAAEASAVLTVFGPDQPPISSLKGATGHLLGVSGVFSTAVSLLGLRRGLLPATRNLDDPDPKCADLDLIRDSPRSTDGSKLALVNAFGFGGHNISLVLAV